MADIPDQMKKDNWDLYVLARSNDPRVKIPYTRDLVSSLINSMRIAGESEYNKVLLRSLAISNNAFYLFSELEQANWGAAVQECAGVLDQITFLLYDKRWSSSKSDSFKNLLTRGETGGT